MSKSGGKVQVPAGLHFWSRFFAATEGLWRRLGDLETSVVSDEIESVRVDRPVYVTSLARAGTTIVTEMLEKHPALTSHRYSDFPNTWTPYWRNHLLQASRRESPQLQERAHKDRIQVSQDSPEAVEEVLWMHFFSGIHDETRSQVLDSDTESPAFERFYTDHIRKLLAVRQAPRYLAKGNYNLARLRYLRKLFPEARFVIPVRDPAAHIASLAKQHRLFVEATRQDARVVRQLALSGHFEFGPHRTFVHYGDDDAARAIRSAWDQGREVEGWARSWALSYTHLARQLQSDAGLRRSVFLFRYEDLCRHSESVIDRMLDHCELDAAAFAATRQDYASRLTLPDYYRPDFGADEQAIIDRTCRPVLDDLEYFIDRAV